MHDSYSSKRKNWQWRIIIWSSLFLIFGKGLGLWIYHHLGVEQAYNTSTAIATKVGLNEAFKMSHPPVLKELIIDVRNDTPNDYTFETHSNTGTVNFIGHHLGAGEVKRFTINTQSSQPYSTGHILFLSSPMPGSNNTLCKEIHTLNFDSNEPNRSKHPLTINLSSVSSKLDCK